jgi:hypothetical protein
MAVPVPVPVPTSTTYFLGPSARHPTHSLIFPLLLRSSPLSTYTVTRSRSI